MLITSFYLVHNYHLIIEFEASQYRIVDLLLFVDASMLEGAATELISVTPHADGLLLPNDDHISAMALFENSLPLQLPTEQGLMP